MFSNMDQIKKASKESNSTARHWFDHSSMRFFNTKLIEGVYPLNQMGTIFITSEYRDDPEDTAYTLRYATRDGDGAFKIQTIDGFMDYETQEDAEEAACAYQRFYFLLVED